MVMGKILPVGEWLPDQADFGNPGAAVITNVVPATGRVEGGRLCDRPVPGRVLVINLVRNAGDLHEPD